MNPRVHLFLEGAHLYFEEGSRFVNSHKTREFPRFVLFNKHSEPSGAACIRLCYTKTTITSTMVLLKEITEALERTRANHKKVVEAGGS